MATEKEIVERLEKLKALRKEHGVRAVSLVPDVAFLALIDDVGDAAEAVLELLKSPKPYRAITMSKVALRASQRLLVISGDADYWKIGVRTWLSTALRDAGDLAEADQKTLEAWTKFVPGSLDMLQQQIAEMKAQPWRTETFMWDNPAPDVSAVFLALGREQHAGLQLPAAGLTVDSEGMVKTADRPRTTTEVTPLVMAALDIAVRDATASVLKRIALLKEEKAKRLAATAAAAAAHKAATAANKAAAGIFEYKDDLGMYLMKHGVGSESVLPEVQLRTINDLPDDSLSVIGVVDHDKSVHSATFQFKGDLRDQLLKLVDRKYPDLPMPRVDGFLQVELPESIRVAVTAVPGEMQETDGESIVPLLVTKLD